MENLNRTYTGEIINGLKLVTLLGQGAFGHVYKVIDVVTNETFALKMVVKSSNNPKRNVQNEFNLLKQFDSPYLIKLFRDDFYAFKKYYCFLTEFCEVKFINCLTKLN